MTLKTVEEILNDPWLIPMYDNFISKSEKEIALITLLTNDRQATLTALLTALEGEKRKSIVVMSPAEIVQDAIKFKRHSNQAFNDGHSTGYNTAITQAISIAKQLLTPTV